MFGPNHPGTGICVNLKGNINGTMAKFAESKLLFERALYSMTDASGEKSVLGANGQYESVCC
jgi:hypothetical protein